MNLNPALGQPDQIAIQALQIGGLVEVELDLVASARG